MSTATPRRNRVSITNLNTRISRIWRAVFPSANKVTPSATDKIKVEDASGDFWYITVNQLGVVTGTQLPSYLSSALPTAVPAGQVIYISDEGIMAYSNGTDWIS